MIINAGYILSNPGNPNSIPLRDKGIYIQEGKIIEIGEFSTIKKKYREEEIIGGDNFLAMPGLIDCHSHGRGLSPLRGGVDYDHLELWLSRTSKVPSPGKYLNSAYSAIKHIKSGITGMVYIHIPPFPTLNSNQLFQDSLAAFQDAGLRLSAGYSIKDRNFITYDDQKFLNELPSSLTQAASELIPEETDGDLFDRFAREFKELKNKYEKENMNIFLAPTGPQWCSKSLMEKLTKLALSTDSKVHIHTLQTVRQKEFGQQLPEGGLLEYMNETGLLDTDLTLGHAIWLTEKDIELIKSKSVSITHHAGCNLHLKNGIAPVANYLSNEVPVAVGLDDKPISEDEDMFQEMRLINSLHGQNNKELSGYSLNPADVLNMATKNGGIIGGLTAYSGKIQKGSAADIILIDTNRIKEPWIHPDSDIRTLLFHKGLAKDVQTVIVGGKVIMKNGKIRTVNENEIKRKFSANLTAEITKKKKESDIRSDLKPHIRSFYEGWTPDSYEPYYNVNSKK
ncbi:amidohydrolase family protein [Candidatus Bipolaricaulota bacterium]|nr:amidohydrolase family protein [Candidatus Bipolaricaulota bacterium]